MSKLDYNSGGTSCGRARRVPVVLNVFLKIRIQKKLPRGVLDVATATYSDLPFPWARCIHVIIFRIIQLFCVQK